MPHDCPDAMQLFDWLSASQDQRQPVLTSHIYGCSACSKVVMEEVRIRRSRRRIQGLSGVAAVAILSLSLWQSQPVFSTSAAPGQEVAAQPAPEPPKFPTDFPQPVDEDGNLYWADYRSSREDPTPYPADEEVFNERSPRVIAWLKKKYLIDESVRFYEEGQKYRSVNIPPGTPLVLEMSEAEFREFGEAKATTIPGVVVQAIQRAEAERASYMLPVILLWYKNERYMSLTGWHSPFHDDAARFIKSFNPAEVYEALENYPDDEWREQAREVYEGSFLQ